MNGAADRSPFGGAARDVAGAGGRSPFGGAARDVTGAGGRSPSGGAAGDVAGAGGRSPSGGAGDGTPGVDGRWVDVGGEADLPPGSAVSVPAGTGEVAVFNVEGEWLAVEGRCLHKGGVLAEGLVSGGVVTCPLHWWRYDLRTGERLGAPDLRLACYPVRITGGRVEVLLPPAAPAPPSLRDRLLAAARNRPTAGPATGAGVAPSAGAPPSARGAG